MKGNGIKVVKRFYFQDGERLYPEGGYDYISKPIDNLKPHIFQVDLNGKEGMVTEDNEEVIPLGDFTGIGHLLVRLGEQFYFSVYKRNDKNKSLKGIIRLEKKDDKWTYTVVVPCEWKDTSWSVGQDGWLKVYPDTCDDRVGLVNLITGVKIAPVYDQIEEFENGLAPVGIITKKVDGRNIGIKHIFRYYDWGMINEQGELVVRIRYPDEEFEKIKSELIAKYGKK